MFQVFNCRRLLRARPIQCYLEAWRRSRCPSSGSLTVSLTLLRCDGAFMQSISDQAGVMQLGFFVSVRYCKTAVFAQEGVRDLWQECCQHIHGFLVHSAVVAKNEWNHPIIAIRASIFDNLTLERVAYNLLRQRTQVAFLYWNSISGFSNLSDTGRLPWALSTERVVTMMVYLGQDTVHHVIMAHCSDSGVSAASDFVLSGHFLSTQQTLAVRVELFNQFVQNLKSVFYQVEEFIIGQISEIVYDIANGRYSRVILKGVEVFSAAEL
ncbi:Hypothetical_protein [Hexamita inflata]|uniref:Hypothetical_protein n=1 Tax=Hexamita inflata TaxID=28002 RepID=A0AA86QSL6_9EUKA|nr:Hypothetical protein HINF_LOCUS44920 [Hexamita inflata]